MKLILVPILLLLMLVQSFSKLVVVIEYNLNKDYIAKNFCINRFKPKMHCNGKCQMMKRLAEDEKQNSTNHPNTTRIKVQDLVLSDQITRPVLPALPCTALSYNEEPPLLKYTSPIRFIFHPPAVA